MRWESYDTKDYEGLIKNLSDVGISYTADTELNNCYTVSADIPDDVEFVFTEKGKKEVEYYIKGLSSKRKEILDARKDTAEDTNLPTADDILADIPFEGIDERGEYYNGWGVTDHYDADYPILLKLGRDINIVVK